MMIERLFAVFEKYLPLDNPEKQDLSKRVLQRIIKRRQIILAENDVCKNYFFVARGLFRKYQVDKRGGEHNLQFISEGEWIMEIESFYTGRPSRVFVEAMEESIILQIKKKDLLYLFVHNPKFDRNFRVFTENRIVELENRVLQSISSSAEENYLAFIQKYPMLASRIPGTQLASYLGITPEFLSRMRQKIKNKPKSLQSRPKKDD